MYVPIQVLSYIMNISDTLKGLYILLGDAALGDDELMEVVIPSVRNLQYLQLTDALIMDCEHWEYPESFHDWTKDHFNSFVDLSVSARWGHECFYEYANNWYKNATIDMLFDLNSDWCLPRLFGGNNEVI